MQASIASCVIFNWIECDEFTFQTNREDVKMIEEKYFLLSARQNTNIV